MTTLVRLLGFQRQASKRSMASQPRVCQALIRNHRIHHNSTKRGQTPAVFTIKPVVSYCATAWRRVCHTTCWDANRRWP